MAPDGSKPRVLVTRAAHQGSELADRLRALGAEPVLIPTIQTVPPSSFAALEAALGRLDTFDWLLFTSANAVEVFAARCPNPAALPMRLQVAAIGSSTRRKLEQAGIAVHLVPEKAVGESLAAALLPFARRQNGAAARFLLVRAEDGRDVLPQTLRDAGAEVVIAPAYRTVIPQGSVEQLQHLFRIPGAPPAAITFTSSSTARNLVSLCQAAAVQLPESALRISIGPITSQTLADLGLPPHAEAPEATVASLAQTVLHLLAHQ